MHSMAQVSMMNPEAKQHVRLPDDVGMVRSITLEHCAHPSMPSWHVLAAALH